MQRFFALAIAGTCLAAPLAAQQPAAAPDSVTTAVAIRLMKSTLRNLVTAQEAYWADHGSYTTDGKALGVYPAPKNAPLPQVITAGSRGWTAMTTMRALKGKSCVIYVGYTSELVGGLPKTMGGIVAKNEGEPLCDEP